MKENQTFGFSLAIAYCKKCQKTEGYNGNDPYSEPKNCRFCGGEMTNDQKEKFLDMLDETFNMRVETAIKRIKEGENKCQKI